MIIKPLTFDDYLASRLGMGTYQSRQVSIALLINFLDGIEWAFLSIVISIVANQWALTQNQISFLGSSFFIGVFLGNLFCIFFADRLGRQRTLSVLMALAFFIALLMYLTDSFYPFLVLRVFYGFVYGGTIPSAFVLISEIVLLNYRGVTNTALNLAMSFGKIYLCLLCFVFLDDFQTGNWKGLLLVNLFPIAICGLSTLAFLNESPRYYLIHQKF